ncbi:MAG: cupin domain-containing protein [Promethearchaeota archaeon]
MVRIYRIGEAEKAVRAGYEASYVADLIFREPLDSCGIILVDIDPDGKSSPHAHEHLEEAFIALSPLSIYVNNICHELNEGDVVLVDPGEAHSFESRTEMKGRMLAMKFPNIKDDKVVPVGGGED